MDVADMYSELNDHGFTDTGTPRKLGMLNDALYDAAARESWPHLETSANLTFDGSSQVATNQPADLGSVMELVDLTNGNRPLEWVRLDVLDKQGVDHTQTGTPLYYFFLGDEIHFWPIPPASTSIRLRYYRIPAPLVDGMLSASIDWPVPHHRVLVLGALFRLYDLEDDPELAVRFQQHFEQRIQVAVGDQFQRQVDRPDRIYMDPWFDYDPFD
jgi:hypothetical protein